MDVDSPSDAELISASRQRPEMIGVLYERHAAAVYRYLARRAQRPVAEDLLSEVFVAALSARKRVVLHPSGSALPWLYGIAGNVLRTYLRRSARRAPIHPETGLDWDAIDDRLIAQSQRTQLRAAVNGLSRSERDLLLLVAWEGLTPGQAAEALGITQTAARTRLHRARTNALRTLTSLSTSNSAPSTASLDSTPDQEN